MKILTFLKTKKMISKMKKKKILIQNILQF